MLGCKAKDKLVDALDQTDAMDESDTMDAMDTMVAKGAMDDLRSIINCFHSNPTSECLQISHVFLQVFYQPKHLAFCLTRSL